MSNSLLESIEKFVKKEAGRKEVLASFYLDHRVEKIIHSCRFKKNALHITSQPEAVHDVATLFFEHYLVKHDKITDVNGIYSLVYRIAELSLVDKLKRSTKLMYVNNSILEDSDGDEDASSIDLVAHDYEEANRMEEKVISVVDQHNASKKLGDLFKELIDKGGLNRETIIKSVQAKKQNLMASLSNKVIKRTLTFTKKNGLSPEHAELADIRHRLQIGLRDFSNELCISQSCLTSYLYGRTSNVPTPVMRAARNLEKEYSAMNYLAKAERFKDIGKLVQEWMDLLGMNDYELISKIIDRHPVSIRRWIDGKIDPGTRALWEHDQAIRQFVRISQQSSG